MDIYYNNHKISDSKSFANRVLEILEKEYNIDIKSLGVEKPENFILPVFDGNGEGVKPGIEDGVYTGDYVDISGREEFKNFNADITSEQAVFTPTDTSLTSFKDYIESTSYKEDLDDYYNSHAEFEEDIQEFVDETKDELSFNEQDLSEFLAQERAFGVVNAVLDINRGLTEAAVRQVCGNEGVVLTSGFNPVPGDTDEVTKTFKDVFNTDFSSLKDVSDVYHNYKYAGGFDFSSEMFAIPEEVPSACYVCNNGRVEMRSVQDISKDHSFENNLLENLGAGKIYADKLGISVPAKIDKIITDSFKFENLMNRMDASVDSECTQTEEFMAHGLVPMQPGKAYAIPMNFVKSVFQMSPEPIKLKDNPLKYPVSMRLDDFGDDRVVETYADKHVRACPIEYRADSMFYSKRQENTIGSDGFKAALDRFVESKSVDLDGGVSHLIKDNVKFPSGFEDTKQAFDFKYKIENLTQTNDITTDSPDKTPVDD